MAWKVFSSSRLLLALGTIATSSLTHGALASSDVAQACVGSGGNCGNAQVGPNCCLSGQFCQPWNPSYYQCVAKPARCGLPEVGTDYFGGDLSEPSGVTLPETCCNACSSTAGCVAFTFVNFGWDGRPHCYLKKSVDVATKRPSPGAISAVVVSITASNHIQAKIRSGAAKSRAVNLGGWLVSEYWMSWDSPLWAGVPSDSASQGEYNVMKFLGKTKGTAAFEKHRQTWITEADMKEIAATGVLNTVRVPVGHWIIRDATTSPGTEAYMFASGGLKYLDTLINTWAVQYNLATNIDNSLKFATFLAARYKNSPAFLGLALMNEPLPPVDRTALQNYYIQAYKQIRATGNMCILLVTTFLNEQDAEHLYGMIGAPAYVNVWNEIHEYLIWGFSGVSEQRILEEVDAFDQTHLKAAPTNNRLFLGEWCMGGPPDQTGIFQNLDNFRELGRKQLAYYNADLTGGWAFWSWRHSDETIKRTGWSMRYLIRTGYLKLS